MHKTQHGFAHVALLAVLVVLAAIGGAGYLVYAQNKQDDHGPGTGAHTADASNQQPANTPSASTTNSSGCPTTATDLFTADVTKMQNVSLIQAPIRLVAGNQIKTHSYIEVTTVSPVYAPMDATLSGGANYYETMGSNPVTKVQYLLSFNDGCDVTFWFDHLVDVPDAIKNAFPAQAQNDTKNVQVTRTPVKAGDLLGYTNQSARARFDFGAFNVKAPETSLTTNPRFKDDPIVQTSPKYRHAVCPYKLFTAEKRQQYTALYDPTTSGDQEIIDDICK